MLPTDHAPRIIEVSLVIPVRNEADSIAPLLDSILRQTYAPNQVILVDGGSTDGTVGIIQSLTANNSLFSVIEAGRASPGKGRNIGISAARYDWIALADAGMVLEPTWMQYLVQALENEPDLQVIYGNYEPNRNTFFERCAALAYVSAKQERPGGRMRGPSIASSLIRREVWRETGGFPDLRAAEDLIFMERIEQAGFKIGWAPRATVHWQLQPTLLKTFRKFALYSKHNVLAGRERYWHYGVARQYLIAFPFVLMGFFWHVLWFVIPVLWIFARVAKSIWQKQEDRALWGLINPVQSLMVGIILITIDLATFVGWIEALLLRQKKRTTTTHVISTE